MGFGWRPGHDDTMSRAYRYCGTVLGVWRGKNARTFSNEKATISSPLCTIYDELCFGRGALSKVEHGTTFARWELPAWQYHWDDDILDQQKLMLRLMMVREHLLLRLMMVREQLMTWQTAMGLWSGHYIRGLMLQSLLFAMYVLCTDNQAALHTTLFTHSLYWEYSSLNGFWREN